MLLVYLGNSNLKIAISFHFYINFKNFYFLPSLLLFPSTFFKIAISFQFDFDFSVMTEIALNFHRNSPNRQTISGLKIKRIEKNMNVLIAFSRKVSSFWKILLSNVTLLLKNLEWPLSQDSRVSVACKSVWLFFIYSRQKYFTIPTFGWAMYCWKSKFCPYLTSVECLNYIGFASQIRIYLCFNKVTHIGKKLMIFEKIQFCNFYTWSKLSIWCEKYITSMKKDFYLIIK